MSLTWIDYVIIVMLSVSMGIGLIRGFFKEVLSLVVWVIAFVVAIHYSVKLTFLFNTSEHTTLHTSIYFVIILVSVLVIGMLCSFLLNKLLSQLNLGVTNRLLGLVFGLSRSVILIAALMLLVQLSSLPQTAAWQRSAFLPYFTSLSTRLKTFVPKDSTQYFQFLNPKTITKSSE